VQFLESCSRQETKNGSEGACSKGEKNRKAVSGSGDSRLDDGEKVSGRRLQPEREQTSKVAVGWHRSVFLKGVFVLPADIREKGGTKVARPWGGRSPEEEEGSIEEDL